jgi:C1A family cysteine protease
MQKAILILALLAVASFASSYEELNLLWSTWKNLHSKDYSAGEEAARYAIFVDNYEKVTKYNSESTEVKLRLNLFADLTGQEFKHKYTGCARVETDRQLIEENTIRFEAIEAPGDVDWRNKGVVTPVKNQQQCGSCWTFSTTGVLEGYYALNNGKLLSFSEQQIVDCASAAGSGCSGGWPYLAVQYAAGAGLEQESQYPYTAQNGGCKYNQGLTTHTNNGYAFVTDYNSNALKSALGSMPVSVLVEADQQVFQFYSSGVLGTNSGCGASLDHAVLAVGYGTAQGAEAFYVKNSWGPSWGKDGYIYLSTDGSANGGAGVCGVLSQPVVPN